MIYLYHTLILQRAGLAAHSQRSATAAPTPTKTTTPVFSPPRSVTIVSIDSVRFVLESKGQHNKIKEEKKMVVKAFILLALVLRSKNADYSKTAPQNVCRERERERKREKKREWESEQEHERARNSAGENAFDKPLIFNIVQKEGHNGKTSHPGDTKARPWSGVEERVVGGKIMC